MSRRLSIREQLTLRNHNDALIFLDGEGFDECILGTADTNDGPVVAYDYEKLISALREDGLTREEAIEHFDFNIAGSCNGPGMPIFIDPL